MKTAPPAMYEEKVLTLEEVLEKAGSGIEHLKAIADIKIEKDNEPYSFVNASVLIKKPEWTHMRIYQLGMLVRDFVIRDNELYVLSGKNDPNLKTLGRELHHAIFWWEGYQKGTMHREKGVYVVKAMDREIQVDGDTLLPVNQKIRTLNKNIQILYSEPLNNDGFWYPGLLKIQVDNFTFTVRLKKILKNPSLGEFDFQIPAGN
jgi:hypothetical protein